jgi:uncharacterized cofD-like protein
MLSRGAIREVKPESPRSLRIVAIGGGLGFPALLEGLSAHAAQAGDMSRDAVTAVLSVTDDARRSGRPRRQFGIVPPDDVRNCLAALAPDSSYKALLDHRFDNAGLVGHPIGNLLLTALAQITGDFGEAVNRLGDMMGLRGRVLPATCENVQLRAEMISGQILHGEAAIVDRALPIRRLTLEPSVRPLPDVLRALVNADGIVVGPGSLYTTVLPSLLVEGIASTIFGVNAVRIYVADLMTEPAETDRYSLDDHLRTIRQHVVFDLFDYILVNRRPLDKAAAERYAAHGARRVELSMPLRWAGRAQVVECDLGMEYGERTVRHRPESLARAVRALVHAGRPQ